VVRTDSAGATQALIDDVHEGTSHAGLRRPGNEDGVGISAANRGLFARAGVSEWFFLRRLACVGGVGE
jgi:hypothetical protein